MANHSGAEAYSVTRVVPMFESDDPDEDKSCPPGPKMDPVEDELPLNREDKGDARFCSAV
jgi:hypothetical protein